jgi:hypothetical protein
MTSNQENGRIEESDNVDRIRNILFGSQMRDYESRFQKLEERLAREASAVRSELQGQLQALETCKGQGESMTARLNLEQAERREAIEQLAQQIPETLRGLELKINHLEKEGAKDIGELREKILEQSKTLSAELSNKHDEMKDLLDREARQIRAAMTGREALAEVLTELALRLKNESRAPSAS